MLLIAICNYTALLTSLVNLKYLPGTILASEDTVVNKQNSWPSRLDSQNWQSKTKITYLNQKTDRVFLVLKAVWYFPLQIAPTLSSLTIWHTKLLWFDLISISISPASSSHGTPSLTSQSSNFSLLRGHQTQQADSYTQPLLFLFSLPKILLFFFLPLSTHSPNSYWYYSLGLVYLSLKNFPGPS